MTEECVICNKRVALPEYDAHAEGCLLRLIDFSVRRLGRHAATPCGCRGVRSSDTSLCPRRYCYGCGWMTGLQNCRIVGESQSVLMMCRWSERAGSGRRPRRPGTRRRRWRLGQRQVGAVPAIPRRPLPPRLRWRASGG